MSRFKVVSDFQPQGDQPRAIEELVKGLERGAPHQVLLGVTGSGKSLAHDETVWVYRNIHGCQVPELASIGDLIDGFFKKYHQHIWQEDDHEILPLEAIEEPLWTLSLNPSTLSSEVKRITALTRHLSPATLYQVTTDCGRRVTVTGDHNFYVLRDGRLSLLKTSEIRSSDYMPLPLRLQDGEGPDELKFMNVTPYLSNGRMYASVQGWMKEVVNKYEKSFVVKSLRQIGLKDADSRLSNALRLNERLLFDQALRLSQMLKIPLPGNTLIGSKNDKHHVSIEVPVTPRLLQLLGIYVAEGHGESNYLILSVFEDELQRITKDCLGALNVRFGMRKNGGDLQISSSTWASFLGNLCGRDAGTKQLPKFWPELSLTQLAIILNAYFSGDGCVEQAAVTASTASERLSMELLYALNRFGIWARRRKTFKGATNGRNIMRPHWNISVTGQSNLSIFSQKIGFMLDRKQRALERLLIKSSNTNVDVIPLSSSQFRGMREGAKMLQRSLADGAGQDRSAVAMVETGRRRPSRDTLSSWLNVLEPACQTPHLRGEWENVASLIRCRWSPVKEIKEVQTPSQYVYDFTVQDNETFLAGSGLFVHNTFTMAKVIERVQRPVLVMSPNKTLAAQLYSEFKTFFPENAVEYFVSYYDYYQPEAYIPQSDTYIEKDASINDEIDKLRHSATSALLTRRDAIVVASVSCIYGIGSPHKYQAMHLLLTEGQPIDRDEVMRRLIAIQYQRNDADFYRGRFRVRGDILEVFPASYDTAVRVSFSEDRLESLKEVDPLSGSMIRPLTHVALYPATHWVTPQEDLKRAIRDIEAELVPRLELFHHQRKLVELQRLESRTRFDIEMMMEMGYCKGIENYSRHLDGRKPGEPSSTLMDYMPKDSLLMIDESHVTVPQIRGMSEGDRSRKQMLVDYGFRLPSALDNRPLRFDEFTARQPQTVYVSATPSAYERALADGVTVEQVIRPTGLADPIVVIKPATAQVDDLIGEIHNVVKRGERVLVTTLTKKMSEDLAEYLRDLDIKVKYLHSDIETLERIRIIRDLRLGTFDVLVGINLLREGLDLPEVSLVAILDADKEGFLRSETTLIQTMGRAARNVNGRVILYADKMTESIRKAVGETSRRRAVQLDYNQRHGITPETIKKAITDILGSVYEMDYFTIPVVAEGGADYVPPDELPMLISKLEQKMHQAAEDLDFETAAALRDKIRGLKGELSGGMSLRPALQGEARHGRPAKSEERDRKNAEIERRHKSRRLMRERVKPLMKAGKRLAKKR